MVMPWWSTQAWFPVILGMLEDYPRLLPSWRDLVNLPTGQEFIMPQGAPVLASAAATSNLHVDMETEPSEM